MKLNKNVIHIVTDWVNVSKIPSSLVYMKQERMFDGRASVWLICNKKEAQK